MATKHSDTASIVADVQRVLGEIQGQFEKTSIAYERLKKTRSARDAEHLRVMRNGMLMYRKLQQELDQLAAEMEEMINELATKS